MIETINQVTTITCDKCGTIQKASKEEYNEVFFQKGWAMNPYAKKYFHLCRNCQTKKQKESHDFVVKKMTSNEKSKNKFIDEITKFDKTFYKLMDKE